MSARRLTAAALAAGLLLAGCGGGEDEPPGATLPPVTAEPTPSATAADVPPEAQEATPEGAAEFGRYFYETIDRAFKTLDTTELEAISAPECPACQRFIASIQGFAADGVQVEGNDYTIRESVAPADVGNTETAQVLVVYDATAARAVSPSGEVILEEPARQNVAATVTLRREQDSWLVTDAVVQ